MTEKQFFCSIAGVVHRQPELSHAPEDKQGAQEGVTGVLATPRDSTERAAASKNPSIFGPLRCALHTLLDAINVVDRVG